MLLIKNDTLKICFIPELIYYRIHHLCPILIKLHYSSTINDFNDSFNDLYIEVHNNIHSLKNIKTFNAWTIQIFKRNHSKKETAIHSIANLSINDFSYKIINRHDINSYLNILNSIERKILIMNYYEDIPLKDLQNDLNLSYTCIRTIKYRAINKLRQQMSRN